MHLKVTESANFSRLSLPEQEGRERSRVETPTPIAHNFFVLRCSHWPEVAEDEEKEEEEEAEDLLSTERGAGAGVCLRVTEPYTPYAAFLFFSWIPA